MTRSATPGEPETEAGRALLEGHGHVEVLDEDPAGGPSWCKADDEPWPCPFAQNILAIEAEARAESSASPGLDVDALLAELAESPLPGARYAYTVVKRHAATASPGPSQDDIEAKVDDIVERYGGALDALASPGLDVERLHGAMATVESELTRQGVIVGRDADLSDYVDAIVIKYAALAADRETPA